jgi:methionyl-tRNA formyltransferase
VSDGKTFLHIATSDGYLNLLEVQPEGKKRMPIADFLRGTPIQ